MRRVVVTSLGGADVLFDRVWPALHEPGKQRLVRSTFIHCRPGVGAGVQRAQAALN